MTMVSAAIAGIFITPTATRISIKPQQHRGCRRNHHGDHDETFKQFDIAKETLRRWLGECHQEPAADGTYTTKQLTEALYGDLYGARAEDSKRAGRKAAHRERG